MSQNIWQNSMQLGPYSILFQKKTEQDVYLERTRLSDWYLKQTSQFV